MGSVRCAFSADGCLKPGCDGGPEIREDTKGNMTCGDMNAPSNANCGHGEGHRNIKSKWHLYKLASLHADLKMAAKRATACT
jgi:hypothetical protein